jgi:AraC-like DNA-binding protein
MDYIIAAGVFQSAIAVALLWLNKKRNRNDTLLITLVACIGVHLFAKWVIYAIIDDKDVKLAMNTFIQLAYGPLIYLYVRKLKDGYILPIYTILFLPVIIAAIVYFSVVSLLVFEPAIGHSTLKVYNDWSTYIIVIGNGLYSIVTYYLLKKCNLLLAEYKLVQQICWIFLSLTVLSLTFMLINGGNQALILLRCIAYTMFIVICFLVVRYKYVSGIYLQTETNAKNQLNQQVKAEENQESVHDRKSILSMDQLRHFAEVLNTYMQRTKAYQDVDFSMDKLSFDTNISRRYISETLNIYFLKSFYQYINEYRIDEFLQELNRRIERDLEINMLIMAYQCGFKTKSSFNQYFKKIVGTTPTAYIKKNERNVSV